MKRVIVALMLCAVGCGSVPTAPSGPPPSVPLGDVRVELFGVGAISVLVGQGIYIQPPTGTWRTDTTGDVLRQTGPWTWRVDRAGEVVLTVTQTCQRTDPCGTIVQWAVTVTAR